MRTRLAVRVMATVCATFSMPFLLAAGQVYPDIPGGVVFLTGVIALWQPNGRWRYVTFMAVGLLPWFQIKFVALSAVLLVAALVRWRQDRASVATLGRALLPVLIGAVTLAAYNLHMIGSLNPYQRDGAQAFDAPAVQRFIGLIADQNQGLLFASPVLLLCVPGLVLLVRQDRLVGAATALGIMVILLLNAMHTNSYGGASFSGRFGWTAAIVAGFPVAYVLARLGARACWALVATTALSLAYQVVAFARYANVDTVPTLLNKDAVTPLPGYGNIFTEFSNLLPAWYAPTWALTSGRNWAWLGAVAAALCACTLSACFLGKRSPAPASRRIVVGACCIAAVASLGIVLASKPPAASQRATYPAWSFSGSTGVVVGEDRVARVGESDPGLLVYGPPVSGQPGIHLEPGSYLAIFEFSKASKSAAPIGEALVVQVAGHRRVMASVPLASVARRAELAFRLAQSTLVSFQVVWSGQSDVVIHEFVIRRLRS